MPSDGRNAVSSLQEKCQRLGEVCEFQLMRAEGESHKPMFTMEARLTVGDQRLVVKGQGGSKKAAKESAASNMMDQLNQIETR